MTYQRTLESHRNQPFYVHDLLADFTCDEVWAYPITARPSAGQDFAFFCRVMTEAPTEPKGAAGLLFRLRQSLGRIFRWDDGDPLPIPERTETSLRDRLPGSDLEPPTNAPEPDGMGFQLVYETDSERLVELSNRTVHAALHIGWVLKGDDLYEPQIAVYWKARGWFGRLYMKLITPFRVWIVYPALMKLAARRWREAVRKLPAETKSAAASVQTDRRPPGRHDRLVSPAARRPRP